MGVNGQIVELDNEGDLEIIFTPKVRKSKMEKQRDGSLVVHWIPTELKDYRIEILYKKSNINGSPWHVKVSQKRDYRWTDFVFNF